MEWNLRPSSLWEWDNLFELEQKKPAPANQDFSSGGGISSGDTTASSVSASMTSSSFGDSKPFTLDGFEPVPARASKQPESSSSPAEPFLSLKLGKRLYFKDICTHETTTGDADVTAVTKMPATSSSSGKRTKPLSCPSGVAGPPRCQVEGCNLDLTSAKDYHRKHRICENHSKSPRVVVAGIERRFCQQCSRFHGLSEFDEKKRSCRRRLSDHNARRRKPQPEAVRLNPSRFSSIYDEPQKMNLVFDQSPRLFAGNLAWDHSGAITTMTSEGGATNKKTGFAWDHGPKAVHHTKEYLSRPASTKSIGAHHGQIFFPSSQSPGNITSTTSTTMLYPTNKSTAPEYLHPAMEESELNTSQDLHRALSLLSANSWGARETKPVPSQVQQHLAPLASSELWETDPANLPLPRGSGNAANFQDLQLFKPATSDSGFYSYQFN